MSTRGKSTSHKKWPAVQLATMRRVSSTCKIPSLMLVDIARNLQILLRNSHPPQESGTANAYRSNRPCSMIQQKQGTSADCNKNKGGEHKTKVGVRFDRSSLCTLEKEYLKLRLGPHRGVCSSPSAKQVCRIPSSTKQRRICAGFEVPPHPNTLEAILGVECTQVIFYCLWHM